MTLSLDTSVVVALLRGRSPDVRHRYDQALLADTPMAVSAVVIHELLTGVHRSQHPDRQTALVARMLRDVPRADFTADDAVASSQVQASLNARGRPIGDIDVLIAGQALARGWTVVTCNVRHFGQVDGLGIIDWAVSGEPLAPSEIASRF